MNSSKSDTPEQKKAVKEIRSISRFPDENPNPIFRVAANGNIIYANRGCQPLMKMWGREVGQSPPQELKRNIVGALKTGKLKEIELECNNRIYSLAIVPILDENYVNVYGSEITARKQAEKTTRMREERFSALAQTASDAIISIDSDGKIVFWNKAAEKIFGYSVKEVIGKPLTRIMPEGFRKAHTKGIRRVVSTGETRIIGKVVEVNGLRKNGSEFAMDLSLARWKTNEGVFFTGIARDITDRKRAQEKMKQQTHDFDERVKELNCLYSIAKLAETPEITIEEMIRGTVDLIPHSYQSSDVTGARIKLYDDVISSSNFKESQWKQTSDILVKNKPVGIVEVVYLEEKPQSDEGPFLKEERNLINAISKQLGIIIERVQAEDLLNESENRYRTVVEESSEKISRFLPDGTIIFVNQHYCEFFGKEYDEMIGTNIQSTIPEEDKEKVMSSINSLSEESPAQTFENKVKIPNGEIRWIRWTNRALFDEKGRVTSYQSFGQDITERVKIEQALRQSEEQYRSVVEDSPGIIDRFTPDGTITFVNQRYCEFYGKEYDEVVGTNIQSTIPEEDREKVMSGFASLSAESPIRSSEIKNVKHDGEIRWMRWTDRALFDNQGQIISIQSFGQDITGIVEAEQALKKEQEKAQKYLDIAEVLILALNQKGEITLINEKGNKILGYEEDELLGKNWFDTCVPTQNRKKRKQFFRKVMAREDELVEYNEIPILTKSGEELIIASHNAILWDENESIIGFLSSGEDITERKQTEKHLKYISLHDIMTGTFNRTYFDEEMARLEKSRLHPISILVADMDNLKEINDQHGHKVGDVALQNVAEIIKNCFRPEDVVARIGGDEFAVLLPNTGSDEAQKARKRIIQGIDNHNKEKKETIPLSLSIGWAIAESGKTLEKAFKIADEKMYEVKQVKEKEKKDF